MGFDSVESDGYSSDCIEVLHGLWAADFVAWPGQPQHGRAALLVLVLSKWSELG